MVMPYDRQGAERKKGHLGDSIGLIARGSLVQIQPDDKPYDERNCPSKRHDVEESSDERLMPVGRMTTTM